jgi:hypothetical protein
MSTFSLILAWAALLFRCWVSGDDARFSGIDGRFHDFTTFSSIRLATLFWLLCSWIFLRLMVLDLPLRISPSLLCIVVRHVIGADDTLLDGWIDIMLASFPSFLWRLWFGLVLDTLLKIDGYEAVLYIHTCIFPLFSCYAVCAISGGSLSASTATALFFLLFSHIKLAR